MNSSLPLVSSDGSWSCLKSFHRVCPSGFKSSFPTKASALPSPPPGLSPGTTAAKPPPGFTRIPLNSNVVDPAPTAVDPWASLHSSHLTSPLFSAGFIYSPFPPSLPPRPPKLPGSVYLVPDDFHQRNLQLILSIRKYLNNDESKFNEFKNYSAQFRQVRRSPSPSWNAHCGWNAERRNISIISSIRKCVFRFQFVFSFSLAIFSFNFLPFSALGSLRHVRSATASILVHVKETTASSWEHRIFILFILSIILWCRKTLLDF